MNGIEMAINAVGGRKATLAKLVGVSRQVVEYWTKTGRVPPQHVRSVSKATGVPAGKLNDLFKR